MENPSALQQQTPCSPDQPEVNTADSFNTSIVIASQTEPDSVNCKGAVSPGTLQTTKYEELAKLLKQTSSIPNKLLEAETFELSDSADTNTGTVDVTGSSEKTAESGYLDVAYLNQILDSNSDRKVAVEKPGLGPLISLDKKYRKQMKSKVNRLVPDSETENPVQSGDDSAKKEPETFKEHSDVHETNIQDKDETVHVVDSVDVREQTTDVIIQEVDEEIQSVNNGEAIEIESNSSENTTECSENRGNNFKTDECNEKTSTSSMHDNENLKLGSDADVKKDEVKNLDSKIMNKQIDSGLGQETGVGEGIVGSTTREYNDVQLLIDFAAKVGNDGVNNESETTTIEEKAGKHAEETAKAIQQSKVINTEHEVLGNADNDSSDANESSNNNSSNADTARNRTERDISVHSEIISADSSDPSDSIEKDNVPGSKILKESVLQNETDQMQIVAVANGNTVSQMEIEGHNVEADIEDINVEDESKVRSSEQIEDTPKTSEQPNIGAANYDDVGRNNENCTYEEEENKDASEGETLMIIDVRSLTVDDSNEVCFNEDKNENSDDAPVRNKTVPFNKDNDADFEVIDDSLNIENKVVSGESQLRILEETIKTAVKESEELAKDDKDFFEHSNSETNELCEQSDDFVSAEEGATISKNIVPGVIKIPVEKTSSLNKGLVPSVVTIPKDSLSSSKADRTVEARSNVLKSNDVHECRPGSLNTFLEGQSKALESILNTTTSDSQDTVPLNTTNATGSGTKASVDIKNTTTAGKRVKSPVYIYNTKTAVSNPLKDSDDLVNTKAITGYQAKTPVCLAKSSDSNLVNTVTTAGNQSKSSDTTTSHVNTATTTDSRIVTIGLENSATCLLSKISTHHENPVPLSLLNPANASEDQTKLLKSSQLANTQDNIGNVSTTSGSRTTEDVSFGNVRDSTGEKTKAPVSAENSIYTYQSPVNVSANLMVPATSSGPDSSIPVNEGNESLPVITNAFSIKDFFDTVKQEPPDDGTYGVLQSTSGSILAKQGASVTSTASATYIPLPVKRNPTIHQGKIIKSGSTGLTNTTNTPKIVMAKVNSLQKTGQSERGLVTAKITSQNLVNQTQTLAAITTHSITGKAVSVTINNAKTPFTAPLAVNIVKTIRPQTTDAAVKPKTSIVVVHPNSFKSVDTQDSAQNNKLTTINIFSVGVARITDLIARKNPIPTYKPARPPDELKMADTLEVYECYECGDRFNFERSLKIHLGRCSMKIFFKCEKCHKTLIFTNKCQLLCHLRSHLKIHKSQAVPIHIKSDSIEIRTNFDDIKPGQPFEWYKESLAVPFLNNGAYQSKTCTMCNKNFVTDEELQKHYAGNTGKQLFCSECPLFMNSQCALLAHGKLHELTNMKRPHHNLTMQKDLALMKNLTCPECGKHFVLKNNCPSKFSEITNIFLLHLKMECFHMSRLPTYKCTKCKVVCQGKEELRNHIFTSLDQYYKCGKCPMALKSLKSLDSHFVQKHVTVENAEESGNSRAKIIYRCHICDTLIDDKSFLLQHVEKHMEGNVAEVIYHCLQCGQLFETKTSLVVHFKAHALIRNHFMCTFCPRRKMDALSYIAHILHFHTASESYRSPACVVRFCNLCGLVCKGELMSRKHICLAMKNAPKVVGDRPEKTENQRTGEKVKSAAETSTLDDIVVIDSLVVVKETCRDPVPSHLSPKCLHCDREFTSSADRRNHLNFIRDSDHIYICKFCDKTPFNKYHDLTSHEICCNARKQMIEKNHIRTVIEKLYDSLPDKNKQISSEKIETEGVQLFPKGNKRKRKQQSEVVKSYTCDQCDEVFTRKSKQEEHIKLEHGFHPCHLCGLMHESQSSLKKHLMIDHEGKRMMFFCGICKLRKIDKAFSLKVKLEKHLRQKHKMKVIDESKIITALPGLDSSKETSPANEQKRRNSESSYSDLPAKKVKFEEAKNSFNCAKCLFKCEMRSEFRQHIVQHLTADSYQCYECGLCFAVLPSLKKHLFMVHKIRNFENYMEENKIEAPVALEDKDIGIIREPETQEVIEESSEEDAFGNPLECRVCYKVFESEKNLRGHMRVHGMAFIKKTRRRALTSSPNKKREHEVSSPEKEGEKRGLILKIKKSRIESTDNKTDGSDCTVHYATESNDNNRSSVGENEKQVKNEEVTVDADIETE